MLLAVALIATSAPVALATELPVPAVVVVAPVAVVVAPAPVPVRDADVVTCRVDQVIGSLIKTSKQCHSRREWQDIRDTAQDELLRATMGH